MTTVCENQDSGISVTESGLSRTSGIVRRENAHATRKRARTGCFNCRRRRRKCDESKPTCASCQKHGEDCEWRVMGNFRESNMKALGPQHPSMKQAAGRKCSQRGGFEILNVTPGISRKRRKGTIPDGRQASPASEKRDDQIPRSLTENETSPGSRREDSSTIDPARCDSESQGIPLASGIGSVDLYPSYNDRLLQGEESTPSSYLSPGFSPDTYSNVPPYAHNISSQRELHDDYNRSERNPDRISDAARVYDDSAFQKGSITPQSTLGCGQASSAETPPNASFHTHPDFAVAELMALRYMPNRFANISTSHNRQNDGRSPPTSIPEVRERPVTTPFFQQDLLDDQLNLPDDIFLPGSAYEALHTTLRNRQLGTARSSAPSRQEYPTSVLNVRSLVNDPSDGAEAEPDPSRAGKLAELTPYREYVLWQNYLEEICSWLDMFDNNKHFAHTFSQMAKSVPHLRYSILALSARQMERMDLRQSQSESLALYQEAIHLLLPELETKTTPVIASCVILCVLEMLSCNPKEWRRHLDGCAYLIQAAGINGFSGKEEQALFWCFARMDVCGGLISEEETIIPTYHWIPRDMTLWKASRTFLNSRDSFDIYANYAVFLCAQALGVLFGCRSKSRCVCKSCRDAGDYELYTPSWKRLFDLLEEWHENRPSEMRALFTVPSADMKDKDMPFPTVLYGNGSAISGNQLYHTCALLLLQHKPKDVRLEKKTKSIFWHARQICAISASNTHHGCWTNSLQPLWIAGKVMSHGSEHSAIIDTLARIEKETGWATSWRVDDLIEFWGDDGDGDYGDSRIESRSDREMR